MKGSDGQAEGRVEAVQNDYADLVELYRIKETLSRIYNYANRDTAELYLKVWYDLVICCVHPEMVAAAKSIWSKKEEILMWYEVRINNGFAEGMNSLIQTTKRVARGYGNVDNYVLSLYRGLECVPVLTVAANSGEIQASHKGAKHSENCYGHSGRYGSISSSFLNYSASDLGEPVSNHV